MLMRTMLLGLLLGGSSLAQGQTSSADYVVTMPLNPAKFVAAVEVLNGHPFAKGSLELRTALFNWVNEDKNTTVTVVVCKQQAPLLMAVPKQATAQLLFSQFILNSAADQINAPKASYHDHEKRGMIELLRMYTLMKAKGVTDPYGEQVYAAYQRQGEAGLEPFLCGEPAP